VYGFSLKDRCVSVMTTSIGPVAGSCTELTSMFRLKDEPGHAGPVTIAVPLPRKKPVVG
jgi:hypothetical protein